MAHLLPRILRVPSQWGRVSDAAILPVRLFLGGAFIEASPRTLTNPRVFSPMVPALSGAVRAHAAVTAAAYSSCSPGAAHARARPLGQQTLARSAFMRGLGVAEVSVVGGRAGDDPVRRARFGKVVGAVTDLDIVGGSTRAKATPIAAPAAPADKALLNNVQRPSITRPAPYTDPISDNPALLVRLPDGPFVADDAVRTRAGCAVHDDLSRRALVCPCHGAAADPAYEAQLRAGPAPHALGAAAGDGRRAWQRLWEDVGQRIGQEASELRTQGL